MSPNVGNFVHDLVEMAKAMETLPQVEHERDQLKAEVDHLSQSVQDRELRIVDYKSKIDELLARVRATEAERDDAELRFLEVEDRLSSVVNSFRAMQTTLGQAVDVLDPPKPQPEPEPAQPPIPEAVHSIELQPQVQSENPPISAPITSTEDLSKSSVEAPQPPASQGQGEVNPTTISTPQSISGTNDGGEVAKLSGPYTNKYYIQVDGYISRNDWLAGGGTEESYDWRPASVTGSF